MCKAFFHLLPTLFLLFCGGAAFSQDLPALVRDNDVAAVKKILTRSNVNTTDEDGDALLLNAALYASTDMMKLLLQKGANPNATNKDGETALMWAVQDIEKVKLLLKHGADVNRQSASGNTALLIASVGAAAYETVKLLLDNGANPLLKNGRKETALMRAALFGDSATLALLAKNGNDVNAMDTTRSTALINALFNVNREATFWLLNNGANPDTIAAFGLTAIAAVVTFNDFPSVQAVLQRTKKINTVDDGGYSALMWAVYNEHDNPAIIQALLEKGADVNMKAKNGETALTWAMRKGNTATVALLKKWGAQ